MPRKAVKPSFFKRGDEHADFVKVYSLLPRKAYFAIAEEAETEHTIRRTRAADGTAEEASDAGQLSMEHLYELMFGLLQRRKEFRKLLESDVDSTGSINDTDQKLEIFQ